MRFYIKSPLLLLFILVSFCRASGSTIQNVKFVSQGDTLAGTIIKPDHPFAAVVMVHGSGQEKRMMEFAAVLAKNNIAVLTYDKRGVGASGGVYAGPEVGTNNIDSANLSLLSLDASAAVNTLVKHLATDQVPVGLIGFSQAGWIIPLAARKNPNVRFMVLFSGPVVTAREQLRFQFFTQGDADFWDTHTEAEARKHIIGDADRYSFADTDPRDALSKLSIPGLWLFGGKDIQIPTGLSIERLNKLKSNNKRYAYKLFPALGHNTAFSDVQEPVQTAIRWMKAH
ncbi:alpha/beta fold hydrolase [Niabella sp.]|uniref:alpha/beta hydrolase family protein n=1 Tax=Niabella sp. TaxID=1962976 RepID=UPI00263042FA|nr:alpha/beta fold hydrolase [Niabella sp.]